MSNAYEGLSISPYELSDLVYRYSQQISDVGNWLRDYGTGEFYSSVEVHTVSAIEKNPGITVTEYAILASRTKAAVSQMILKLEKRGLIRREQDASDKKKQKLFLTEEGLELSRRHKEADKINLAQSLDELIDHFGLEAVQNYVDILQYIVDHETERIRKEYKSNGLFRGNMGSANK